MPAEDTYSITYQYKTDEWHSHYRVDPETADMIIRMLCDLGRDFRVRQNATGLVYEGLACARGIESLILLNLFSKGISGRNGQDTDEED